MDISLFMKQEWIMYSVYAALLFLVIQTDGYKDQCTVSSYSILLLNKILTICEK